MGMSTGGNGDGLGGSTLSEINVTPLVDVMLVLLIIFMVSASVETVRVEREMKEIQENNMDEDEIPEDTHPSQKVGIDLPKVNAEQVNLQEERKLVLTLNLDTQFYLSDNLIADCREYSPDKSTPPSADSPAFDECLTQLEKKLLANEKLAEDNELYLRADRAIAYGKPLKVMARIRKAGITKFGLIAEPDLE